MAVEVLDYQGFPNLQREEDADEAMAACLHSMQNLVTLLAKQQPNLQRLDQEDCAVPAMAAAATILGFSSTSAISGGSGHARFRRAPASASAASRGLDLAMASSPLQEIPAQTNWCLGMDARPSAPQCEVADAGTCARTADVQDAFRFSRDTQKLHACRWSGGVMMRDGAPQIGVASKTTQNSSQEVSGHARCRSSTVQKPCHQQESVGMEPNHNRPCKSERDHAGFMPSSSVRSSISIEGGAGGTVSMVIGSGRPPLPPKKRKAPEKIESTSMKSHKSSPCHCAKRRMEKTRRRVLRVSITGLKDEEIPEDGYSWCIYGKKLSRDSSRLRVYYKCNDVRGCPARKHVERASDNADVLVITYGREHPHTRIHKAGDA